MTLNNQKPLINAVIHSETCYLVSRKYLYNLRSVDGRKEWAVASITYLLILQILQVIKSFLLNDFK